MRVLVTPCVCAYSLLTYMFVVPVVAWVLVMFARVVTRSVCDLLCVGVVGPLVLEPFAYARSDT